MKSFSSSVLCRYAETTTVGQNLTLLKCGMVGHEKHPTSCTNALHPKEEHKAMDSH